MFPLSDSIKSTSFPLVTLLIIALNIVVFLQEITAPNTDAFILAYSLVPAAIDFSNPSTWWPFVTSMFLHGGFFHIISNMWFLWVFGDNVESHLGKVKYLFLYFGTGILGGLLQYYFSPDSTIPMLGASGAVSGVLGAYYVMFPHSRIKTLLPLFFIITIVEIPAVIYLFYWFFLQLFQGITSLPTLNVAEGGVAFWAHIGGFIGGVILAKTIGTKDKGYIEGEIV